MSASVFMTFSLSSVPIAYTRHNYRATVGTRKGPPVETSGPHEQTSYHHRRYHQNESGDPAGGLRVAARSRGKGGTNARRDQVHDITYRGTCVQPPFGPCQRPALNRFPHA
jgi:hypothetical protein